MLKTKNKGNWDRTSKFFNKSIKITKIKDIKNFAEKCIERLREETPKDSGLTAESWNYEIHKTKNKNGFVGVEKVGGKFKAKIRYNGTDIRSRSFETAIEAHIEYILLRKKYVCIVEL